MISKVALFGLLAFAGKSDYALLQEGKLKCSDSGLVSILDKGECTIAAQELKVHRGAKEAFPQSEGDRPYGCRVQTFGPPLWVNTRTSTRVKSSKTHQVICKKPPTPHPTPAPTLRSVGEYSEGRFRYLDLSNTDDFPISAGPEKETVAYRSFTLAAEVYPEWGDRTAITKTIFGNSGPRGTRDNLVISARQRSYQKEAAKWQVEFGNSPCWTSVDVIQQEWVHVTVTFDWYDRSNMWKGKVTLYINGVEAFVCKPRARYEGNAMLLLGASTNDEGEPLFPWLGKIRNFQGWNRLLSADEVRAVAQSPDLPLAMVEEVVPVRWVTVMGCDGESLGDRILVDDVAGLAKGAHGLRVCTTGTEDCVTATAKNEGLTSLASGSTSFMPPGIGWCQEECVNERWTGPEKLKFHMRWQCGPNRGHMMYHACGNTKGLHLDSRSGKQCTWDWGNKDAVSVQLLVGIPPTQMPTSVPTVQPSPVPTPDPTPYPTPKPTTLSPTPNPTPMPSPNPTPKPTLSEASREFDPTGKKLIQENVCFGARSNEYGALDITHDMAVSGIYLVHRSGGVNNWRGKGNCNNQYFKSDGKGMSNFGGECNRRISMFITDASDTLVAPTPATAGFKPDHAAWYYLDGFNSHSKYLGFEQDAKLRKGGYRVWYGEDKAGHTEHDNSGTSCVDVYVAEKPMIFPMTGDGWAKIGDNVCIGTRGNTFGRFTIPFGEFTASKVKIVHKTGYVNCRRWKKACPKNDMTNGQSNFGCECTDKLSIMVTGSDDKLVLPADSASVTSGWYSLAGFHSHSDEIVFNTPRIFSTGEYRVWYGEDLWGHTESDNMGRACYDVLALIDK